MTHRAGLRILVRFAALGLAAALPGCSGDSGDSGGGFPPVPTAAPTTAADPDAVASAFSISPLPDRMTLDAAVTGTAEQEFSSDSFGGTKPMLMIVPDDWDGIDDHRWIEIQSIDGSGNEGGFGQELPSFSAPESGGARFEVDGHPAVRLPSIERPGNNWQSAAFVAVNTSATIAQGLEGGDMRGVLVTGVPDNLRLFESIVRSVTVDKWRTPALEEMPDGWRALGVLNASQATGPNDWPGESLPIGRRAMRFSEGRNAPVIITAFGGDETTTQLKAIEAMWSSHNQSQFLPTEQLEVDGADAYLSLCCKALQGQAIDTDATAWFSIDGTPFEVSGKVDLLGTPELVAKFASTIKVIPDDEWSEYPHPVETVTTGTSTTSTVTTEG